jgi:acyl-CoA thioester hydrolase
MGIVYNGQYFTYFEVGRTELFRDRGFPYSRFENAGYQLPLVESKARYYSPAEYDDLLDIEARLDLELKAVIRFEYKITRGDDLICEGYTVHSFFNAATKKPVKPPKIFREVIESFIKDNNL